MAALLTFDEAIARLHGVRRLGLNDATALCPSHEDHEPSLSVTRHKHGQAVFSCHAGCNWQEVSAALGFSPGLSTPSRGTATVQRLSKTPGKRAAPSVAPESKGCTLAKYAGAKKLPIDFLQSLGLRDLNYDGVPAIRVPYFSPEGKLDAARLRIALNAKDRFRWRSRDKPRLYGLWRLDTKAAVVLVEGESDCHTLWHHDINAVGLPGATNWREDRDAPHLADSERINVVIEPDQGGKAVLDWIKASSIRDRVWLVSLGEHSDASSLHIDDAERFKERWAEALSNAEKWTDRQAAQRTLEAGEALARCEKLANEKDILEHFVCALRAAGIVGEKRAAKLIYLSLLSRFFQRPISAAIKGASSSGKSFLLESVLTFFPADAYYSVTAMSEHALAYSTESLKHRFLVVFEDGGLEGDFQSYLIRSLLSEGRIRYETVVKTSEGLEAILIEREGPTGLLVTTTRVRLHPENETRLLSIHVTDSPEQTSGILEALADEDQIDGVPDLEQWHALQVWLGQAKHGVSIPFALKLSKMVPPSAVRLRRDFKVLLNAIRAHACLHQASREVDEKGRVVATLADYAAVYELVADLVAEGVEATVPPIVRETVKAVKSLTDSGLLDVPLPPLMKALKLDRGPVSRRVRAAIDRGYLNNNETRKGRPMRLVMGDPMPENLEILPSPARLQRVLHCCAPDLGDAPHPPPNDQSAAHALKEHPSADWEWASNEADRRAESGAQR